MTVTKLSELRSFMDGIKEISGEGSKTKKQQRFEDAYSVPMVHVLTGETWDDSGVGPSTARDAVEQLYDIDTSEYPTISESLHNAEGGDDIDNLGTLVEDLHELSEKSGNEQEEMLVNMLDAYSEPSIVTVALLQDEKINLGTTLMRETFFDGSRDERKRLEALNPGTANFIIRARNDNLIQEPKLFNPFDPMLAEREEAGRPDNCVAQFKVDGNRLLLHVRSQAEGPSQAEAYTRKRKRETQSLPELQEIDWPEGEFIIDCEVIAETGSYSDTSSRIGRKPENIDRRTEPDMEFACFDILHINGEDVTQQPLEERYELLETLTMEQIRDPRIYLLEMSSDIQTVKQLAAEKGFEGVILKDLYSEYELGKRSRKWVKEKHERSHIDVRVVDLVEGEGKQYGMLGKFIIESKEGEPLGGVGTGFSDELASRIWRNQGEWIGGTIEISAEGYDPSGDGGLRFPVFERDRRDDGEPDTIDRVKSLLDPA